MLPEGDLLGNTNDRTVGLLKVIDDWIWGGARKDAVIARYGNIQDWDMSGVTSLNNLFYFKEIFNADLSKVRLFP